MNFFPTTLSLTLLLSLCACSGSKKKTSGDDFGPKYKERMASAERALFRDDHSQRSPYEKQLGNDKKNKNVKKQAFKTGDFHSGKPFSGGDDKFKTGAYSQSDKTSNAANKTFSGAGKQSALGNDEFKTSESRFSQQSDSDNAKQSPLGDDTFRTKSDREGSKAMENSQRPYIAPRGEDGYSEGDIRKMLNKG